MSQENVEIVRRAAVAWGRGEIDELVSDIDPKFELRSAILGGAEGTVFRGHDGIRRWFASSSESFEEMSVEWSDFRGLDDRVLALGCVRARGRGSGVRLESPIGWVFTVGRGKLVRGDGFFSHAEALEAVGLSE
jgi:ketosteroid isomerase-like protein